MNPGKLLPSHPACGEGFRPARPALPTAPGSSGPRSERDGRVGACAARGARRRRRAGSSLADGRRASRPPPSTAWCRAGSARPAPRERREPRCSPSRRGAPRGGAARQRHRAGRSARRRAGSTWCSICRGSTPSTEYVPEDMVASVEAGMTLGALDARLSRPRASAGPRSVWRRARGPSAACSRRSASGPLRFRYGTGRDLLLGVRFVQADGTHHVGRRAGREVGDRLRRAEAPGGLARHARRRSWGPRCDCIPLPAVERDVALRVRGERGGAGVSRRAARRRRSSPSASSVLNARAGARSAACRATAPRAIARVDRERRGGGGGAGRRARRAASRRARRPRRAARRGALWTRLDAAARRPASC